MKIDVCFSPALYPVYHNPEAIVVVVDVFRATTTMAAAFSNGVRSIRPVATVEEAVLKLALEIFGNQTLLVI